MTDRPVPISLGKPSLRRRLEDYYSLIAPEQISNTQEWLNKYGVIYEKFGGSYEGERKLATKLANKYGTTVRLLLAESALTPAAAAVPQAVGSGPLNNSSTKRDEEWYTAKPVRSGDVCFTSPTLDCMALLFGLDNDGTIERANPYMVNSAKLLDNVSKFTHYLPDCDPLHRLLLQVRRNHNNKRPLEDDRTTTTSTTTTITPRPPFLVNVKQHSSHNSALTAIAAPYANINAGPLSVLYRCMMQRQRLRVVIRHRHRHLDNNSNNNSNRGTLTGYVIGFDAHWNLFLKDVMEVTMKKNNNSTTTTTTSMIPHQRHLSQLLVRGDNIILVYPSEGERSDIVSKTST